MSRTPESPKGPSESERMPDRNVGLLASALGVFYFFLVLRPPYHPDPVFSDHACYASYAEFLLHGFKAGSDYIFTFGPLGHFLHPTFHEQLFWLDYVVLIAAAALVAGWLTAFTLMLPTTIARFALPIYFAFHVIEFPETTYIPAALAGSAVILRTTKYRVPQLVVLAMMLAFFSLTKFTLMVMLFGVAAFTVLCLWAKKEHRSAYILSGAFLGFVVFFAALASQSPFDLVRYVLTSLEIARAYGESLAIAIDASAIGRNLFWHGLVFFASARLVILEPNKFLQAFRWILLLVFIYVMWRIGFVRHFRSAAPAFIYFVFLFGLAPAARLVRFDQIFPAVCAAWIVIEVVLLPDDSLSERTGRHLRELPQRAQFVVAPWQLKRTLEEYRDIHDAEYQLPMFTEIIGDGTVDMFPPHQNIVFINKWNYHPRPVFQGYQARIGELMRVNADFYEGKADATPPDYVIFGFARIDYILPALEDSFAFQALLTNYRPAARSRFAVLYERLPESQWRSIETSDTVSATGRIGEWIDISELSHSPLIGQFQIQYSTRGRVHSAIQGAPQPKIELELSDGSSLEHDLPIAAAKEPFLFSPYFSPTSAELGFAHGKASPRVMRFRIGAGSPHFDETFEYDLSPYRIVSPVQ